MTLSKRSVEMLLDLVEIKISYMDVLDRQDNRDLQILWRCREELKRMAEAGPAPIPDGEFGEAVDAGGACAQVAPARTFESPRLGGERVERPRAR